MSRVRWPIPSHDASPLAPVTTRIITPVDPAGDYLTNEIKLRDNFSRVVVDGWGTSDSGHVWTNVGDSAAYSDVDGHRGTFEPTVSGQRGAQEVTLGSGHFSGIFRWAFSAAPSSNLNRLEIFLRNTAGTQGSRIRIENNASDDINIYVVDYATGISLPGSKTFTVTNTYVYPDEYWMRFEAIGPFVKLKAWKLGDVEPATWQVEGYDTTDRAKIAFAGTRVSPNQVIFYYDDITVIADPISSATFSEGIADTTNNSATSDLTLLSAEAQALNNSGSGSFTVADATAETLSNSAQSTQTFLEGIGDSPVNSATGSQTVLSAEAEAANNSGSGSFVTADATAETVSNSAESTQTIDEVVFVPGAVVPLITKVSAHSYPELVPVTKFIGAFTVSALQITETVTNQATSTQTLSEAEAQAISNSSSASVTILSAEAQALNNSGSGSFTVADATAETVSVSQTSIQSILEALAEAATNAATAVIVLTAEATAETNTNSVTNTPAILSAEAQAANNSGTGSFTTADATAETVLNSATSTQTLFELIAFVEDILNFATAIISILSAEAQAANNSGSGSFTTADATAETLSNSATTVITIDEVITGQTVEETIDNIATANISIISAEAQAANVAGTGSFTVADATAEDILNSGISTQTLEEALAEIFVSSATNIPAIVAADLEALVNSGTATITDAEAIAESMGSFATALHSMLENGTIRLFPDEDISTGTWHDTPLWPKIDEMNPVGGYPTEAIISGNDPVNDTAVLGLQTGSDPSMDIDHFINVQFYKIGAPTDDIDFIIKLKQGSTVIATRTFVDVQETEAAPRTERIGLTTGEVTNITNYGDLRFEIIANKTN